LLKLRRETESACGAIGRKLQCAAGIFRLSYSLKVLRGGSVL
jgi:hypothetical protein